METELTYGSLVVPHCGGSALLDDRDIDIGTGTQVVPDTAPDRSRDHVDRLLLGHMLLEAALEDGHGGQTAGTHRHVGKLVGRTVCVDREQVGARRVDTSQNEVSTDVALISAVGISMGDPNE